MKKQCLHKRKTSLKSCLSLCVPLSLFLGHTAVQANEIQTTVTPYEVSWVLPSGYSDADVSVGTNRVAGLSYSAVDASGEPRPDGHYTYQISATPQNMVADFQKRKEAREAGDSAEYSRLSNKLQEGSAYNIISDTGEFLIKDGLIEHYDAESADRLPRSQTTPSVEEG